jgi:hypothetical protein
MENGKLVAGIQAGIAGIDREFSDALGYLQSIYRNPLEPTSLRMRAAMAAIPFETPKLAVTTSLSNENFSALLDRAIARSQGAEIKLIELKAEPEPGNG